MKKYKVSIIIPVYNTFDFLNRCLDSIVNQSYNNLEIILINDGSTDNSLDICNEYMKKDSRIIVINKKNNGVSAARNDGIKKASGDFICFFDSDDSVESNMIEILLNNMIINNVDLSICDYSIINGSNAKPKTNNSFLIDNREDYHRNYYLYQGYLWNKMFKTSLVKKISFNESIHCCEDELFITQYVEYCDSFYYDNRKLYNYYIRNNSSSGWTNVNERQATKIVAREKELKILSKYSFDVYKDYYVAHFLSANDIYRRYRPQIIDKNDLNMMYKKLISYNKFDLKFKVIVFIKYRLYWLYYLIKKINY